MPRKPVGWRGESRRHSEAAKKGWRRLKQDALQADADYDMYLATGIHGPKPHTKFERGDIRRAVRDVLAKRIAKSPGVRSPHAVATEQVKEGIKFTGGTLSQRRTIQRQIAHEYMEQSAVVGRKVPLKDAMKAARRWVA